MAGGSAGLGVRELNPGITRNHIGNTAGNQEQGLAIVFAAHQWNGFTLEASYLAVGQDRLQTVSHFNTRPVVFDCVKDQDATVRGFRADAPLVEKVDGVAFDIRAVERIDGNNGDLGMSFFVNLAAKVFDLRFGGLIEDAGEIVDIAGGLELRDGLGPGNDGQRYSEQRDQTEFRAQTHSKIVQEENGRATVRDLTETEFVITELRSVILGRESVLVIVPGPAISRTIYLPLTPGLQLGSILG